MIKNYSGNEKNNINSPNYSNDSLRELNPFINDHI